MSIGISPALHQFYDDLDARKPCIWHQSLHFLGCYSEEFYKRYGSDDLALTWSMVHSGHVIELGYPRETVIADREKPLAIKIWCLKHCLVLGTLLEQLDEVGSINAERIADDVVVWAQSNNETLCTSELDRAREFLRNSVKTIPRSVWKQAM